MSDDFDLNRKRGIAGIAFALCAALTVLGLAIEVLRGPAPAFWIGAEPGARAVIGAGAAVVVIAAAALLRMMLGVRAKAEPEKGARRAGDHA